MIKLSNNHYIRADMIAEVVYDHDRVIVIKNDGTRIQVDPDYGEPKHKLFDRLVLAASAKEPE